MRRLGCCLVAFAALLDSATGESPRAQSVSDECFKFVTLAKTAEISSKFSLLKILEPRETRQEKYFQQPPAVGGQDAANCDRPVPLTPDAAKCAATTNCQQGDHVLYCKFHSLLSKSTWPFGPEYLEAIRERYKSGVVLSKLSLYDFSRAAAFVGEPSLLLLGAAAAVALSV